MGTMDEAWKIACLQKKCRYCDKPAEEWKGGIYYCKKCYEEVIVKQMEKDGEINIEDILSGGEMVE